MNPFARIRFLTAGESHGPGLTGILEGFPAGVPFDSDLIDRELSRRQQGHGRGGRMKIEKDRIQVRGGVRQGKSMGSPIALWLPNRDWENWKDGVMSVTANAQDRKVTLPRPGHADLAGVQKYGFDNIRDVIERSSARETAMRVALGAVCRMLLRRIGIDIGSHVLQIGSIRVEECMIPGDLRELNRQADESPVRCLDANCSQAMVEHIDTMRREGDSLGGVFEIRANGVPAGLGSHTHWDRKLNTRIGAAMHSINAMKAVAIGDGFTAADQPGSAFHDEIVPFESGVRRKTNQAGGIEGGMSNGEDLIVRVVMKPIPTLAKPLQSVDIESGEIKPAHRERTDSCAVPAASIIGEAMLALVLCDAVLERYGGDSLDQVKAHMQSE